MLKLDKSIAPAFFFTIFLSIMVLDDAALQLKMFALALFLFTFTLTSSTIMVKKIHLDFYLIGFFITLFFISFIPLLSDFNLHSFKVLRFVNFALLFTLILSASKAFLERFLFYVAVFGAFSLLLIFLFFPEINPNAFGYSILPAVILLKPKFGFTVFLSIVVFYFGARGAAAAMLLSTLLVLYAGNSILKERIVLYAMIFLIFIALLAQYIITFQYFNNIELNLVLSKRPFIWNSYASIAIADINSLLFGVGEVTSDYAEKAGEIVSENFDASRAYGPHSFYISTIFEYGLLGFILLFSIILKTTLRKDVTISLSIRLLPLIYMFIGFTLPIQLGGFRVYDYFFIISVAFLYSNISKKNYEKDLVLTK